MLVWVIAVCGGLCRFDLLTWFVRFYVVNLLALLFFGWLRYCGCVYYCFGYCICYFDLFGFIVVFVFVMFMTWNASCFI